MGCDIKPIARGYGKNAQYSKTLSYDDVATSLAAMTVVNTEAIARAIDPEGRAKVECSRQQSRRDEAQLEARANDAPVL